MSGDARELLRCLWRGHTWSPPRLAETLASYEHSTPVVTLVAYYCTRCLLQWGYVRGGPVRQPPTRAGFKHLLRRAWWEATT